MATAFLLPRDCLPAYRGSHNASFPGITPGASETFQVSNVLYQDQVRHKINLNGRRVWTAISGSISQPEPSGISISVPKDVDGKKTVANSAKPRATIENVEVFTILQRPKDKEVDTDVIKKLFIKVDEAKATTGHSDSKIEVKTEFNLHSGSKTPFVDVKILKARKVDGAVDGPKVQGSKLDVPKLQSSSTKVDRSILKDRKTERGKHHNGSLSPSKPTSVTKRSSHVKFDELVSGKGLNQMLSPKAIGEHKSLRTAGAAENFSWKLADAKQPEKVGNGEEGRQAQLKRASTDPQIVKHLVTHHRSNVMEIPHSDTKPLGGIMRTSSTSCPERWAGPAYSSSPPPSSLPLPNLSLLNLKIPSSDCSPLLMMGSKGNSPQLPKTSPTNGALTELLLDGDLDVASATRSLRRMLKLEPF